METVIDPQRRATVIDPQIQASQQLPRRSGAGQSQFAQFGPRGNLISSQFDPRPSTRLQGVAETTGSAFQNAQNYQFQGFNPQAPLNTANPQGALSAGNNQAQSQSAAGYRPVAGTDLSRSRSALGGANVNDSGGADAYAGTGGTGSFAYNGDTGGVRGQAVSQLGKVLNTNPDRLTLASNAFKRLQEESNPAYEQELRGVGQRAAALGRVGAGMTTSDLGTVAQRRQEALLREQGRLSDEAASLSLADEDAKLNAARGLSGELAGQDTAAGSLNLGYLNAANQERGAAFDRSRALGQDRFGRSLSLADAETRLAQIGRGDAMDERDAEIGAEGRQNEVLRSKAGANRQYGLDTYGMDADAYDRGTRERDAGLDYDQRMFDNRSRLYGMGADEEQRLTGNERSDRNELRAERGYQYGLDRDAVGDSRYDREYEDRRYDTRFGQGLDLLGAGSTGSPASAYDRYSSQFGEDADSSYGSLGPLFEQYALGRRRAPGQGRPSTGDPLTDLSMS